MTSDGISYISSMIPLGGGGDSGGGGGAGVLAIGGFIVGFFSTGISSGGMSYMSSSIGSWSVPRRLSANISFISSGTVSYISSSIIFSYRDVQVQVYT